MTNRFQSGQLAANKLWLAIGAVVIAFFMLALLLVAAGNGQNTVAPTEAKIHSVNVVEIVQQQHYIEHHSIVGRAEASQMTELGLDSAGVLASVLVDEGQYVKKGQVLATLDEQRLQARRKELQASLFRGEAEARIARLSLTRVKALVARKLESTQALDELIESSTSADAAVDEMKARLNSLDVDLARSKLLAPFDGQISGRVIDIGAAVNPGQALFTLQTMNALEVRMALPTDLASTFSLAQQVELTHGKAKYAATVKSIAKQRLLATQTIDVIFMLVADDPQRVPGDLFSIRQSRQHDGQGYWLPSTSLISSLRGLWSVFVVAQSEQSEHLLSKLVEVLHVEGDRVYVRGALVNRDKVVVDGLQRLVPGQRVKSRTHQDRQSQTPSEPAL